LKILFACIALAFLTGLTSLGQFTLRRPLGLIEPDIPVGMPLTRETVALGKMLFFEPRLSKSGATSCSSCHNPANGFSDPRRLSVRDNGTLTKRHSQSVLNAGFLPTNTWDGKWRTLEQQVLSAFERAGDMGRESEEAIAAISGDPVYERAFSAAFGNKPTAHSMAIAIAQFERSLVSGDSPFDRHVFARDTQALTVEQKEGLAVFSSKGGCLNCHDVFHPDFNPLGGGTALFTDFRFHNLGVGFKFGRFGDVGRFAMTRDPFDLGSFRTPSLRNVDLRPPYMHDGSLATLEEVVAFYNRGGNPNPNLSPSIHPLFLTKEEERLLVVFLKTLTDPRAAKGEYGP
jgi:cytochrome c peroxidase